MSICINGVRVELSIGGAMVLASIGEPRAQEFVTESSPVEAMRSVLRKLSHADDSAR